MRYFPRTVFSWILINPPLPDDRDVVQLSTLEIRHKIAELEASLSGDIAGMWWTVSRGTRAGG